MARAAATFDRAREALVSLAFVRWLPLLEVESALAMRTGFPFGAYADELDRIAAIGASAVCPASAGARHARPFHAMNRLVYPLSASRFLQDARARMPAARVLPFTTGARYTVTGSDVALDERGGIAAGLVVHGAEDAHEGSTDFRPLEIPPVFDPNLDGRAVDAIRATCAAWVESALAPALARSKPDAPSTIRYLLEVVWPGDVDAYTITRTASETTVARTMDPSWDVRCAVAGSMLCDVIEAKRSWGDLLLGGSLRACSRAYTVDARGMREIVLQPLFLYAAISYEESVERALEATVERLIREGTP
jgi:hypothetical protein